MAKKRGNSEGSIYKRPNGTWSVQATLQGRRLEPNLQYATGVPGMVKKDPRPD